MAKILRDAAADLAMCGVLIAVAAVTWREASRLPAGRYDPLGGGTMPMIVSAGIILLCLVAMALSVLKAAGAHRRKLETGPAGAAPQRPLLAAAIFLNTVFFTLMIWVRIPFWVSSSIFMFVSILAITRFARSSILPEAVLSLLAGVSMTYVFGSIFQVDLP